MKTIKNITVVGNSLGITIDKWILKKLKLQRGDRVEVDIIKDED